MNRDAMDFGGLGRDLDRKRQEQETAELLAERGKDYGDYGDVANFAQIFKSMVNERIEVRLKRGQPRPSDVAIETLDMIATKIGRILAGRWDLVDNWDDIGGYAKLVADRVRPPAPEETGCADDCVHPSHRHVPRYDEQNEPTNGADTLGWNKPPCQCPEGFCMTDKSSPPKYVYCRKAEGVAREPVCVMWSEPTPKNPCHCGVDCYTKSTGMALPAGTVCRKADQ